MRSSGKGWTVVTDVEKITDLALKNGVKGMDRAGLYLEGQIKKKISQKGTGQIYFRRKGSPGKRGKVASGGAAINSYTMHQASAPGQPPVVDTGYYRRSISYEVLTRRKKIVGRVGTNMKLGRWLELGTKRMKPRPHLRPALVENWKKVNRLATMDIIKK